MKGLILSPIKQKVIYEFGLKITFCPEAESFSRGSKMHLIVFEHLFYLKFCLYLSSFNLSSKESYNNLLVNCFTFDVIKPNFQIGVEILTFEVNKYFAFFIVLKN